jgi:hypothetical protein
MAITKIQSESLNLSDNYDFTGTVTGAGGTNTPNFRAKIIADTSFTTATYTGVVFPSEDFDTASAYDTSNGRFTVPTGQGGKYFIYSQLLINSGGNGELTYSEIALYKNGTRVRGIHTNHTTGYPRRTGFNLVTVEDLSAGDYLQIYVYAQDLSGNPDLYNDATKYENFFGAYKIIE